METLDSAKKGNYIKLRSKITVVFCTMLISLMTVSTILIGFIIFIQNRDASFAMLEHAKDIIQEQMDDKMNKLNSVNKQIADNQNIIQSLDSIMILQKDSVNASEIEFMKKKIVQHLYEQVQMSLIWKSLIYSKEGDLICFVLTRINDVVIGFPHQGKYYVVFLKHEEKLGYHSWDIVDSFDGIKDVTAVHTPVKKEDTQFAIVGSSVAVRAESKAYIKRYNESTDGDEPVAVADVVSVHQFDIKEIQHYSRFSRSKINVFAGNQLSVGNLPVYKNIQTDPFPDINQNWDLKSQKASFNTVNIKGRSFFQGVFPFYGNQKRLGYIAILYKSENAMQNTWQIIIVLCIVGAVGTILLIPLVLFIMTRISRPLEGMAKVIDEVRDTGDFSNRVLIANKDEVGIIGLAYNELMETLQLAFSGINSVMETVADGDLTNKLEGDFTGDVKRLQNSINRALEMLGNTVIQVIGVSDHVHSSSVELKNAAQNLANGSSQQAASLEEISSSMVEVRQSATKNKEYAENALGLTGKTIDTVQAGNEKMDSMLHSMNRIHGTSLEVAKVIKVIDEIAFQTNLLALNAAVEAARAGKFGKGFAVVAEEVRNLASRSAEAARNTSELIESAVQKVESGVTEANETADALDKITESVNEVKSLIDKIAEASKQQQSGTEEINKGLELINGVVQQNSSISEETSSSSVVLLSHAKNLNDLMQRFKVGEQEIEIIEQTEKELVQEDFNRIEYQEIPELEIDSE